MNSGIENYGESLKAPCVISFVANLVVRCENYGVSKITVFLDCLYDISDFKNPQ